MTKVDIFSSSSYMTIRLLVRPVTKTYLQDKYSYAKTRNTAQEAVNSKNTMKKFVLLRGKVIYYL